jgi:hypothetical protein
MFERRLSAKTDFELGKTAATWMGTSRIWGTSKTLLDGTVDNEETKCKLTSLPPSACANTSTASPLRHESFSNHGQTNKPQGPSRSPTDANSGTGLQPKAAPWSTMSSSAGFTSRQRGQPLSPTAQRQSHQYTDFVADSANGIQEQRSLFVGSDPDVDEISSELQHQPNHRRVLANQSRALPSPARASGFGSTQPDTHAPSLNLARFQANSAFSYAKENEVERDRALDGLLRANGNSDFLPLFDGGDAFNPSRDMRPENTFQPGINLSREGQASNRSFHTEYLDSLPPAMHPDYDNTIGALGALNLNQAVGTAIFSRHPPTQAQAQRDFERMHQDPGNSDGTFHFSAPHTSRLASRLNPQAPPHYGSLLLGGKNALPPLTNDYRSNITSPYYSASGTPPTGSQSIRSTPASGMSSRTSHHDPLFLERKMMDIDHHGYDVSIYATTSVPLSLSSGYQYNQMPEHAMRMNPLANPYMSHGQTGMHHNPSGPRLLVRELDQAHAIRSPVLEDFRLNSKSNRRFELKDIYGYVVEFSGDQHGSRFIQTKLETANSDEKEQIFKEILPNVLQLSTDVFGNYVIQKLFEHGSQAQKKMLAHHMKGRVQYLSTQAYGCRVVQKAFEHVLTDQQASLVKELDGPNQQILKVVKDQNGNHVVQKAIECIPGEHIQFIVDGHRGQLAKMSTHQYGCRVVQRMLEHCEPAVKRVILDELLQQIHPLIGDSFGNYVVQHIIHNGEPQDRRQVIDIILSQLLNFSKHKFASNIVEKSIDRADEDQLEQLMHGLTAPNEFGVTPVLGLMRDQFGNYVIRKFPCVPWTT